MRTSSNTQASCLVRILGIVGLTPDLVCTAGRPTGLYHAMKAILAAQGLRGLFQGHLATLLRIFPYAGVKFMAYDKAEGVSRLVARVTGSVRDRLAH